MGRKKEYIENKAAYMSYIIQFGIETAFQKVKFGEKRAKKGRGVMKDVGANR